jgi:hypothetical protein
VRDGNERRMQKCYHPTASYPQTPQGGLRFFTSFESVL